ncbi:MAG: hypothetical protein P8K66_03255 [Planctomycetota bacterium]|nr:hypothetical protein [Planctomycetota bacterium]
MRLIILWFLLGTLPLFAAEREQPVQVFILAGQSNMEGKGAVNTLPQLGDDPECGHLLADIKNAEGSWRVRDDVFVDNLGHDGPLTVNFRSRGDSHEEKIRPELGIGNVLGGAIEAPMLLIKTAWAMSHGMTSLLGLAELPERKVTGKGAYQFAHRSVNVPSAVLENISGAHGGFAVDRISEGGDGTTWFCLKGVGLIRIDSEMTQMEVIGGDPAIVNANMHNTTILRVEKKRFLILPSDEAQKVFVCSDSGKVIRVFDNPYATGKGATEAFRVCDVEIIDGFLYAANGYANNVVFVADPLQGVDGNPVKGAWSPFTFGGSGTDHGKFGTAHGITRIPGSDAFTVADRANARLETFLVGGQYLGGINFEPGTMPCDVDYVDRVAVVGCLKGAGGKTPAPIHILEEGNLVSTLRLQEDLGLEGWTHVHNAAVRSIAPEGKLGMPRLMIIASSWNPGRIAILEQIIPKK